ncbi:hypothetical protein [Neochlamydia sp. AcF84]|uniref:hypothetical protein n=1 Tax=Neochlamydia sp. AcF84 TaxID=2315858 RepID=UPI001F615C13|nr:hypothetical protein [Neochlamydia sp. AcF84]
MQWLHLKSNQLTTLPIEIGQLFGLEGLDLNDNRLTTLPIEIGHLPQLQWLYLGNTI